MVCGIVRWTRLDWKQTEVWWGYCQWRRARISVIQEIAYVGPTVSCDIRANGRLSASASHRKKMKLTISFVDSFQWSRQLSISPLNETETRWVRHRRAG